MRTVAFIPARGGSKGIPKKNIKEIHGKPLIAWSIEDAKKSKRIDSVYVSTDSIEIASCAAEYGAEVPFMRPESLSTDTATTESAMLHFCEWLMLENISFDNIMLVQPTSPIRSEDSFDKAIDYFEDNDLDSLVTVANSHRFFWKNLGHPVALYDYLNRPRRQEIPEEEFHYMETGSFYITKIKNFMESKNRICGKVGLYLTSEEESFEIDSFLDFKVCEAILKQKKGD